MNEINYTALYDDLYTNGYFTSAQMHAGHLAWPVTREIARRWPGCTVLDVGCGHGPSVAYLNANGCFAMGVDASSVVIGRTLRMRRPCVVGSACNLPFPDKSFDVVMHADVFEHLQQLDAVRAIGQCLRVARQHVFCRIATSPAKQRPTAKAKAMGVKNLHLTVRPLDWWIQAFVAQGATVLERYRRTSTILLRPPP
jgi:ubiquinone/menaquinone biosynthesis C-methylase UbiE